MKINAAALAILAGYIATTSCVPVPEAPTLETRSPAKREAKTEIVAPLDDWHGDSERDVEARSPVKPEDEVEVVAPLANWHGESKRACPRCTLGDDGNAVANKPIEAEGLDKRMSPQCTFWEQQNSIY